jgi:hypothetical protein
MATLVVAPSGPGFALNVGTKPIVATLTVCVATPRKLLAVKVKVRAPTSFEDGVKFNCPVPSAKL